MEQPKDDNGINMLLKNLGIHTGEDLESFKQQILDCSSVLEEIKRNIEQGETISEENACILISFFSKISRAALSATTELVLKAESRYQL